MVAALTSRRLVPWVEERPMRLRICARPFPFGDLGCLPSAVGPPRVHVHVVRAFLEDVGQSARRAYDARRGVNSGTLVAPRRKPTLGAQVGSFNWSSLLCVVSWLARRGSASSALFERVGSHVASNVIRVPHGTQPLA